MSEERHDKLDEQQRLAQDAVHSLERPQADPDFRARLKAQFVEGRIPESEDSPGLSVVDGTGDATERPVSSPAPRRNWAAWGGLAAAAVIAIVFFSTAKLPGPELMAANGAGAVTIDGVRYPTHDAEGLAGALQPGARVVVEDEAVLDVAYPGSFFMRLDHGTDIVLPERPGRWTGRAVAADMAGGEISVRTGPALAGGQLTVTTPEASTVIHGTLVSVVSNGELSCICLFEGHADVLADGRKLGELPAGKRWVVFRDGRDPEQMDIAPPHLEHMKAFDATLEK